MTSIRAKENLHHSNCAQNKTKQTTRSSLQNKKIVYQFVFSEIKQNQLRSVITDPKYVT